MVPPKGVRVSQTGSIIICQCLSDLKDAREFQFAVLVATRVSFFCSKPRMTSYLIIILDIFKRYLIIHIRDKSPKICFFLLCCCLQNCYSIRDSCKDCQNHILTGTHFLRKTMEFNKMMNVGIVVIISLILSKMVRDGVGGGFPRPAAVRHIIWTDS